MGPRALVPQCPATSVISEAGRAGKRAGHPHQKRKKERKKYIDGLPSVYEDREFSV